MLELESVLMESNNIEERLVNHQQATVTPASVWNSWQMARQPVDTHTHTHCGGLSLFLSANFLKVTGILCAILV